MSAFSAAQLLDVWERTLDQTPVQRALLLLASWTGAAPETLAQLSIGQRDSYLLSLRELLFGPHIAGVVTCPMCGGQLEVAFSVSDVRAEPVEGHAQVLSVHVDEYDVDFRLPTSLDVVASADQVTAADARQVLLQRCILSVGCRGQTIAAADCPDSVVDALTSRMAQADPQADIQLGLTCPACLHEWLTQFDVLTFLWTELNAWGHRILYEVHLLASAY